MKEGYIEVTQKMADELNEICRELGFEEDFKPRKIKCIYG